ncbi:hypothetical protein B0O79_1447 [Flavobacteriaceae bacterium MAR_2009_75]|nr:hypothetical protein B0O79_1447 [Flavobacteriaceae bacterium MAR_2009_75]
MKYSKRKYLDFIVRTIDALHSSESEPHFFINNPGFGNIFDILKNEKYRHVLNRKLEEYYGKEYAQTIIASLKSRSLSSFYTPDSIVMVITTYTKNLSAFEPKSISGIRYKFEGSGSIDKIVIKNKDQIFLSKSSLEPDI